MSTIPRVISDCFVTAYGELWLAKGGFRRLGRLWPSVDRINCRGFEYRIEDEE